MQKKNEDCLKVGILGIRGRMGQAIMHESDRVPGLKVVAGTSRVAEPLLSHVFMTEDPREVFERADIVLDFSHHKATSYHLGEARAAGKPVLLGTTGLHEQEMAIVHEAAQHIPLLFAPNTSFGVALLQRVLADISRYMDLSYDVEILDIHHRHKKDSPSGTAVLLGQTVQKGRKEKGLHSPMVAGSRQGCREEGAIGLSAMRGGHLKGEHQVHFIGPHERLVFSHEAFGRELFAQGAIRAAFWLSGQKPGLYAMSDVFEFRH